MVRRIMAIALVFLFGATLAGCAANGYYSPERSIAAGALGGAATGAAVGSIIGAGTGSPIVGAWMGAAAGGVLGAAGGYLYAEYRNSTAPASVVPTQYSYNRPQGHEVNPPSAPTGLSRQPVSGTTPPPAAEKTPGFEVWRKTTLSD
jgi:hypothetical protein